MSLDEVIALAREARLVAQAHPLHPWGATDADLERFAALVAAAEREACAATAERCIQMDRDVNIRSAKAIAFAIRERGQR